MEPQTYRRHVESDGTALLQAVRRDPAATVPSCPDWDAEALLVHTGRVHRWVTGILHDEAVTRPSKPPGPPPGIEDAASWYAEGLHELLRQLTNTDPAREVWNWSADGPAPARFWFRRMAQETVVHRWDAQAATTGPQSIDVDLAVDGIDEFLGFVVDDLTKEPVDGLGGSFVLAPTDSTRSWHLELEPDRLTVTSTGEAQATIAGQVSDVYLWLLHRIATRSPVITKSGDTRVLDAWDAIKFE